jgi:hypothetical protein
VRVVQDYQLLAESLDFTDNIFVLDTGVAFRLPTIPECGFCDTELPANAGDISHPQLSSVLGSRITAVYRDEEEFDYQDSFLLKLDSGKWITQVRSAPSGTGAAGVYVTDEPWSPIETLIRFLH